MFTPPTVMEPEIRGFSSRFISSSMVSIFSRFGFSPGFASTTFGRARCSLREYHRSSRPTMVLLPEPEGPTRAMF